MLPEFHGAQVQLGQGDAPAGGHGFVPVREAFYRKGVVAEKGGHFLWGKSVHIPASPKNIFRVDGFSEAPQENALAEAPRQAQAGRHGGNRVSLLPAENLGENSGNFLPAPGIHVVDVECIPGLGRAADVQRGGTGEVPVSQEQTAGPPLDFLSGTTTSFRACSNTYIYIVSAAERCSAERAMVFRADGFISSKSGNTFKRMKLRV